MKRVERFLTALKGQRPDRVPMFDFLFQQPLYEALIGRRPATYNARDVVACALALDHDAVWLRLRSPTGWQPERVDPNTYADEWGTVFRQTEASWPFDSPIAYPIRDRADLRRYRWPDLAQTKIAAIHPIQRTAGMDLGWVKQNYGNRFYLIGNIDSSRTLPYGTSAEVVAEVQAAIDAAAPGGGYVLASDHSIHDGIPVENTIAMFRKGREYGCDFYRRKE